MRSWAMFGFCWVFLGMYCIWLLCSFSTGLARGQDWGERGRWLRRSSTCVTKGWIYAYVTWNKKLDFQRICSATTQLLQQHNFSCGGITLLLHPWDLHCTQNVKDLRFCLIHIKKRKVLKFYPSETWPGDCGTIYLHSGKKIIVKVSKVII